MTITVTNNDKSDEHWETVDSLGTYESNPGQLIPNGEIWLIKSIIASAGYSQDTTASLMFGTEIVYTTHGEANIKLNRALVGDGAKYLKIKLENGTAGSVAMGLKYDAAKQ